MHGIDWTAIIVASIGALGTLANGAGIVWLWTHLRTPSGKKLGSQVEDTQHVALGNNYRLRRLLGDLGLDAGDDDEQRERMSGDAGN